MEGVICYLPFTLFTLVKLKSNEQGEREKIKANYQLYDSSDYLPIIPIVTHFNLLCLNILTPQAEIRASAQKFFKSPYYLLLTHVKYVENNPPWTPFWARKALL